MTDHDNLHGALAAVQADLPAIGKDHRADTGKFSYTYASLNDVNRALLPLLASHGLTWTCTVSDDPRALVGTLTHATSGEQVTSSWPLSSTTDPQALGSAVTYGRRYMLLAVSGSAPDEDDDGAAAKQGPQSQAERLHARAAEWAGDDDQRRGQIVEWLAGMGAKKVRDLDDTGLGAFAEQLDAWEQA